MRPIGHETQMRDVTRDQQGRYWVRFCGMTARPVTVNRYRGWRWICRACFTASFVAKDLRRNLTAEEKAIAVYGYPDQPAAFRAGLVHTLTCPAFAPFWPFPTTKETAHA